MSDTGSQMGRGVPPREIWLSFALAVLVVPVVLYAVYMRNPVGANVTTFSQNVSRTNNFYYRVRATKAVGNSGWSNALFVTTP